CRWRLADAATVAERYSCEQFNTTSTEDARNSPIQRAILINVQELVRHREVKLHVFLIVLVGDHTARSPRSITGAQLAHRADRQRTAGLKRVDVGPLHEGKNGFHRGC